MSALSATLHAEQQCLFGLVPRPAASVLAAVPQWWACRAAEAGLDGDWLDWRHALLPPPAALDPTIARSHLRDATPHELGEAYVCALDANARVVHGRHYTPATLATALWDELDREGLASRGATLDPACGAGALLLSPVRSVVAEMEKDAAADLPAVRSRVGGTDLDPNAVWLGNAILGAELLPLWARLPPERRERLPALLRVADGLDVARESVAITVMNPPYGRVALDAAGRRRWSLGLYGHANRFGLFLHAAIERTKPGGLIGAVLPASFLGGSYYQRLRNLVAERAPLVRLVFVDQRSGVFASGVLQETCLAVFRRDARSPRVLCSRQRARGAVEREDLGAVELPAQRPDLPWLLPRTSRDEHLVRRAAEHSTRLSDYGWKASTGPLVWNRHKAQISGTPRGDALPIVWAADIEGGQVTPRRARAAQRWVRLRSRDDFMALREPAILVQRTTAPEQPRRLVAAILDRETLDGTWSGAVVVENHVNVLRCSSPASPLTTELFAALLASDVLDRLYRCLSGTVAVSAYELEALPLPSPARLAAWSRTGATALTADALYR